MSDIRSKVGWKGLRFPTPAARFTCAACDESKPVHDEGPTGSDGSRWCQDCAAEGEVTA